MLVLSYYLSTILALALTFDASNFTCQTVYEPLLSIEGYGPSYGFSSHKRGCRPWW
jgi:hypothetical protein